MSGIKKLAGQTLWYGVPTIASRFLGYLMNLSLPLIFAQPSKTADLTQVYAIIPFLNVLFTYGLETAYFRFSQESDPKKLYNTLSVSLLGSTIFFTALLFVFKDDIAGWANLETHPEYITWMAVIIFFDAISTLAFARLRQENRPKRYAFARISGVLMNVGVVILFLAVIPKYLDNHPDSFLKNIYNKNTGIGYYLIGNICGSILTFILLRKEFFQIRFQFDMQIWKKVMRYAYPLIIVGMGGMINDMLSRLIYQHVVNLPEEQAKHELGIFGNIYRLAVLITIMIQAFRMAAEPFFFNRSKEEDAPRTYARVMKFFVIASCFMFLFISLYIDVFRWFFIAVHKPAWVEGLYIVPLLALGNIFLGIYYNLSIWYKLKHKNMLGPDYNCRSINHDCTEYRFDTQIPLPRCSHSHFLLLLIYDDHQLCYGTKILPRTLCKEKTDSLFSTGSADIPGSPGMVYLWANHWFNLGAASLLLLLFTLFVVKN
ncbi:MAG: oligosaccharide flippase family protein [Chitinophagaceae bacterium]|nr:oligosaccharide flippase family protein [Chitinophagaceae bacterium]